MVLIFDMKKIIFFLLIAFTFMTKSSHAQSDWLPWEPLYKDRQIEVEVSFKLYKNSCADGGRYSQIKYRVTGETRSYNFFINWKMNYVNCEGFLYYKINSLNIGSESKLMENQLDQFVYYPSESDFTCSSLENHFYEVDTASTESYGSGIKEQSHNIKMITYYDPAYRQAYYLVWDTRTGANLQYYWSDSLRWDTMAFNIPSPPLPGVLEGKVMFDVYFDTMMKRAFYIVWDTKTGRSIQYVWEDGSWTDLKINLPQQPIENPKGDVMVSTYYSEVEKKAFYTFYDTEGGKSIQFFWSDDHWNDLKYELPPDPLKYKR
jgi:hypothetical protein